MSPEISERSLEEAVECRLLQHGPDACAEYPAAVRDMVNAEKGEVVAGGRFATVRSTRVPSAGVARFLATGKPWLARHPQPRTVTAGTAATFTVQAASGYTDLTYAWRRDGQPLSDGPTPAGSIISGATTRTLTISETALADSGAYDCVVSNSCGGVASASAWLTVTGPLGVPHPGSGKSLGLAIRPNPSAPTTRLAFDLPAAAWVRLEIFDAAGRSVAILADGRRSAGPHEVSWTGETGSGTPAGAGIFFARVSAGGLSETRRLVRTR